MNTEAAVELLLDLRDSGVEVIADGARLRYRPASAMTPTLRARIKRYRADLLMLLGEPNAPAVSGSLGVNADISVRRVPCYCCGSRDFWALARVGYFVCGRCHEPDPGTEQIVWVHVGADRGEGQHA